MPRARSRWLTPAVAALLVITAVAVGLRVYRITRESVWMEEAFSLDLARSTLAGMADKTSHDAHPPLYYALLHFWRLPFGDSEAAIRLLSAICGALTIPAVYGLTKRIYDRPTALVAALLCALSAPNIALAQEARMQPLLLLLTVLSMDLFFQLAAGARGVVFWLYAIVSAGMIYTQYYGFFTFVAQAIFLGVLFVLARDVARRVWLRCLAAQAVAGILFVPWLPVFARQLSGVERDFWVLRVKFKGLMYGVSQYAGEGLLGRIVRPVAIGGALVGVFRRPRADAPQSRLGTIYLLIWIAVVAGLPWAISQISSPIFLPRYSMSASLALLILAARGLTFLPGIAAQLVATGVVVALSVAALPNYYNGYRHDQWRPAVARLEAAAQPGDVVIFNWPAGKQPFDYYVKRLDLIEIGLSDPAASPTPETAKAVIAAAVDGHPRVWLMLSHSNPFGSAEYDYLHAHYREISLDKDPGIYTYLFER